MYPNVLSDSAVLSVFLRLNIIYGQFLPRIVMHKSGLSRHVWYLTGRVSVTFAYCVETAKGTAIFAVEC